MSERKVIILRGPPGSGKSTYAKKLKERDPKGVVVVSADDYFVDPVTGEYHHNPNKQGAAHEHCFYQFLSALAGRRTTIVVDNTNMRRWEVSPYTLAAAAHGYEISLLRFSCTVEQSVARNIHGAPEATIKLMVDGWEDPLPWWPQIDIADPLAPLGSEI